MGASSNARSGSVLLGFPGVETPIQTAQSGHMSSHSPQDVQTSGRARNGVPSSRTTMASVGQKWLQMPHCLQRSRVNTGSFFLVRSLVGMRQLYIRRRQPVADRGTGPRSGRLRRGLRLADRDDGLHQLL